MEKQELKMRLDLLIPINWMSDTFTHGYMNRAEHQEILLQVVELNPNWAKEVIENGEHSLFDVLHDLKGIYSEDKHFLPRIS